MRFTSIALLICLLLSTATIAVTVGQTSSTFVVAPTPAPCRSYDDLTSDMKACEANVMSYVTDAGSDGCKFVKCTPKETPTAAPTTTTAPTTTSNCPDVEVQINRCKEAGMEYDIYPNEKGCKEAKCKQVAQPTQVAQSPPNPPSTECKKYTENGCVVFSCNDGYMVNLCNYCGTNAATPTAVAAPPTVARHTTVVEEAGINPQPEPPKSADERVMLNPQPEPPAPTVLKSKPVNAEEKPSDGTELVRLNPQPEPPAPAGFWGWFKGIFKR